MATAIAAITALGLWLVLASPMGPDLRPLDGELAVGPPAAPPPLEPQPSESIPLELSQKRSEPLERVPRREPRSGRPASSAHRRRPRPPSSDRPAPRESRAESHRPGDDPLELAVHPRPPELRIQLCPTEGPTSRASGLREASDRSLHTIKRPRARHRECATPRLSSGEVVPFSCRKNGVGPWRNPSELREPPRSHLNLEFGPESYGESRT